MEQESELCPICKGRGCWQEQETTDDGMTELVWHYCDNCDGKGIIGTDDDTFDLGGEEVDDE